MIQALSSNSTLSFSSTVNWSDFSSPKFSISGRLLCQVFHSANRYFYWGIGEQFTLVPYINGGAGMIRYGEPLTPREIALKIALYTTSLVALGLLFQPIAACHVAFKASLIFLAAIPVIALVIKVAINYFSASQIRSALWDEQYDRPLDAPLIDRNRAQALLEKEVAVTPEIHAKLQELLPALVHFGGGTDEQRAQIENHTHDSSIVFRIKAYPHLIFKTREEHFLENPEFIDGATSTPERFEKMITGFQIKESYGLGLLCLPNAKRVDVETVLKQPQSWGGQNRKVTVPLIAEKFVEHENDRSLQLDNYAQSGPFLLGGAVQQLVCLIAKMNLSDISLGNCPILKRTHDFSSILVYDLEETKGAHIGIAGDENLDRQGLIASLWQKEHVIMALAEAKRRGILLTDRVNPFEGLKRRQFRKIEEQEALREYHKAYWEDKDQSIYLRVPEPSEIEMPDSLRLSIQELIYSINLQIKENAAKKGSMAAKRRIPIEGPVCDQLKVIDVYGNPTNNLKDSRLHIILEALAKHKFIYSFDDEGNYPYIQC